MPKKRRIGILQLQVTLILCAVTWSITCFVSSLAPYLIFGFVPVVLAILLEPVAYEETPANQKTPVNERNLRDEQSKSAITTPQARALSEALRYRGIHNELEHSDGKKHVDIYVPEARLYLEIDGKYHLTDPEHLFRDLERDSYSHLDGIDTLRIPNSYVDNHLDEVANAISEVARKRQKYGVPAKERTHTRRTRY